MGIVERFDQRDIGLVGEQPVHCRADIGIGVNRKDDGDIVTLCDPADGARDAGHAVAEILRGDGL